MSIDMFPEGFIRYVLDKEDEMAKREKCKNCNNPVLVAIFKGTGWCSDDCRKVIQGETQHATAQTDAGITNLLNSPNGEVNLRGIR